MIKREDFGKRFAIHASREIDEDVYHRIAEVAPDVLAFDANHRPVIPCKRDWYRLSRTTSAIIGVATLRDALYIGGNSEATTDQMLARLGLESQKRFTFGPTVYVLEDVRALAFPVPCRGWQGFWTLAPELESAVRAQLVGTA